MNREGKLFQHENTAKDPSSRTPIGFKMVSDIDKAYEQALAYSLDHFDKNLK